MATRATTLNSFHRFAQPHSLWRTTPPYSRTQCLCRRSRSRPFSSSSRLHNDGDSFRTRLGRAFKDTKIKWYPIPAALGIAFIGFAQIYKKRGEGRRREAEDDVKGGEDQLQEERPRKRQRIRPTGPWCGLLHLMRWHWLIHFQAGTSHVNSTS